MLVCGHTQKTMLHEAVVRNNCALSYMLMTAYQHAHYDIVNKLMQAIAMDKLKFWNSDLMMSVDEKVKRSPTLKQFILRGG